MSGSHAVVVVVDDDDDDDCDAAVIVVVDVVGLRMIIVVRWRRHWGADYGVERGR